MKLEEVLPAVRAGQKMLPMTWAQACELYPDGMAEAGGVIALPHGRLGCHADFACAEDKATGDMEQWTVPQGRWETPVQKELDRLDSVLAAVQDGRLPARDYVQRRDWHCLYCVFYDRCSGE